MDQDIGAWSSRIKIDLEFLQVELGKLKDGVEELHSLITTWRKEL